MSKDLNSNHQSEEIDLGQLFKLIGNAFDRFFKFISKIFNAIYGVLLFILLHFRKRFFWYVGAVLLGLSIGYFMDETSEKVYGANMFIETNFRSSRQVYENVKDLHQLAHVDKDSIELAKRLNITPSQASNLNGFYIKPDIDENYINKMYSEYYNALDSVSRTQTSYELYKKALTPYNFGIHFIGVSSKDKFLYKKIEKTFVNYLSHNQYLEEILKVNKENLNRKNQALLLQIQKTDSLANQYLKIRLEESKKQPVPGSGTNLFMNSGSGESNNLIVDETKVIQKRLILEESRRNVYRDLVEQKNVVNLLSGFPSSGYDIRTWKEHNVIILPLVLLSLALIVFTLIGLRNFIDDQTKNEI